MATITKKALEALEFTASFYCGIDVHKQELAVAIYGKDQMHLEVIRHNIFHTDPAGLAALWAFVEPYHPLGFVMEATGIYHHIVAEFLDAKRESMHEDFEIYIVNPSDAKGLPGHQKNDRVDAERLAKYYAYGLLKNGKPLVRVLEDLKALFRMSARLEKDRTAMKNRIKKTLDRAGIRPKELDLNQEWVNEALHELVHFTGSIETFFQQAMLPESPLYKHLRMIQKHLSQFEPFFSLSLTSAQKALVRQDLFDLDLKTVRQTLLRVEMEKALQSRFLLRDQAYALSTIPGISPRAALWLITELGGINRFSNLREFLSYSGCVPRVAKSANIIYSAHTSRHSNKFIRGIFYQAAVVVTHVVKKESGLKTYASRIYAAKIKTPTLAYCIIAGKIARIAYAALKKSLVFDCTLGLDKVIINRTAASSKFTMVEQKDLKKAKRLLGRIRLIQGCEQFDGEIGNLVQSLEELLGKK
jgi:transposase